LKRSTALSTTPEENQNVKYIALYKRYRTYVGKKVVQFENSLFDSPDYDIFVAMKKDKNVTIPVGQKEPEAPVVNGVLVPALVEAAAPKAKK
jgi:hypothetical protein